MWMFEFVQMVLCKTQLTRFKLKAPRDPGFEQVAGFDLDSCICH